MSSFVDTWGYRSSLPTATVFENTTPSVRATYHGDDGKRFRVVVRQLPNPIGFRARLPGEAKRQGEQ